MKTQIAIWLPVGVHRRMEAARGSVSQAAFVTSALEAALSPSEDADGEAQRCARALSQHLIARGWGIGAAAVRAVSEALDNEC